MGAVILRSVKVKGVVISVVCRPLQVKLSPSSLEKFINLRHACSTFQTLTFWEKVKHLVRLTVWVQLPALMGEEVFILGLKLGPSRSNSLLVPALICQHVSPYSLGCQRQGRPCMMVLEGGERESVSGEIQPTLVWRSLGRHVVWMMVERVWQWEGCQILCKKKKKNSKCCFRKVTFICLISLEPSIEICKFQQ